jgi:hypothetical protein
MVQRPARTESRKRDLICSGVWQDLLRGCSAIEVSTFSISWALRRIGIGIIV